MDTAIAILQALYLKRAAISGEGFMTPLHDTLWHGYVGIVLERYGVAEAQWDSLRRILQRHPDAMVALAETTLVRLGR